MAAAVGGEQDGWYTTFVGKVPFTLPKRYQDPHQIGQGAFGAVIRATDTDTGKKVAIKKMLHPFDTAIHAKRTYRELKLLNDLNHSDAQVIQLYNVFTPERNLDEFQTIYFVFNFLDYDLSQAIKRRLPFPEEHIRHIIYSLLRGLKFIHAGGILHRDLKPINIGIDKNSNVTILDFGLARVTSEVEFTPYVATRWWRAPEVYVNQRKYDEKLDIWSIGCIMAELILLHPIFRGNDQVDQLNKIFEIIGTPSAETMKDICTEDARNYISRLRPQRSKADYNEKFGYKKDDQGKIVSGVSAEGIKLLDRLISFDPRQRPTAAEAIAHPFFENYHDEQDEPTAEPVVDHHQNAEYSIAEWKRIIWEMVAEFLAPSWVNAQPMDEDDD